MNDKTKVELFHHAFHAMNSQLDIVAWNCLKSDFDLVCQDIDLVLKHIEHTISRFNLDSELFFVNQKSTCEIIPLSADLWKYLKQAKEYQRITLGYFDISCGNQIEEIKKGKESNKNICFGFNETVQLNNADRSLQFLKKNTTLDFGGMGKGIALAKINDLLQEYELKNVFISFGNSSILTKGTHPHGSYWPFSLADFPKFKLKLNDDSVSISQSITKNKQGKTHIINPKTGEVCFRNKTVAVRSKNPVDAEVLSTALIAAPKDKHAAIKKQFNFIECKILS
ncbi:MAG: FAD:protein FMN transferase [Prolixibacteraceae bacterium]|jgi:thiamine biosynthesis lipoprotein|nr:FAD:protein FMN transferase [Prolixibacteraceae bacterium]